MKELFTMLLLLFGTLFVLALAWVILEKLYLLPAVLYEMVIGFFPAWCAAHPIIRWGILGVLLFLPALYWIQRFRRWRQEKRLARGYLLAKAALAGRSVELDEQ